MQRFEHTFSRRRLLVLGGAAGGLTLLAACSAAPPVPPAAPAAGATTTAPAASTPASLNVLTFVDAVSGSDSRGAAMREINANFLKKFPNVSVKFDVVPFDQLGPKYMAAFAAGSPPDVSFVRDDYSLRIRGQGGLADLNRWMKAWSKTDLDDFYNKVGFNRGVDGDKRYLMYTFGSVSGLHYRKDL
ncbi:MAG TPA: extracellular solute-binding protein, partial [Chloroflexota bacterium]|nr:extracellular solute-binding protein [Chloroflexota bacterium]